MDRNLLHEAARAAGRFQLLALGHLDRSCPEALERCGQDLAALLGALGYLPSRGRRKG